MAFLLVLLLLLLSAIIMTPFLSFMSTGLAAGRVYGGKTDESYAADSGVEDALWQIKYGHLNTLFTSPHYDFYDFNTDWTYDLSEPVNSRDVAVAIRNVWVPKDIAVPDKTVAKSIIIAGKLVVTGGVSGNSTYKITVSYSPLTGEDLRVSKIGIWLPAGFGYTNGTSNLEANATAPYYSVPAVTTYSGGNAVIWSFTSLSFANLPGANSSSYPVTTEITFQFTASVPGRDLQAVAWITTSGVADIPWAWNADQKVYKISATAGSTIIDAYTVKSELRELTGAISGDYRAAGNSLMRDTNNDHSRDKILPDSFATVSDIPANAQAIAGYLYWSAWRKDASMQTMFLDTCSNLNPPSTKWVVATGTPGSVWSVYSSRFRGGNYASGKDRYLTLKNAVNLSGMLTSEIAAVEFKYWLSGTMSSGDALQLRFSGDGTNWSSPFNVFKYGDSVTTSAPSSANFIFVIPRQYLTANFKMRYTLVGFSGTSKYANIDDIEIVKMAADTAVKFKIDGQQVYLDASGNPQVGANEIIADTTQLLPNFDGSTLHGYSYACYKDVTELVQAYAQKAADPAVNHPGNGNYTVGNVIGDTLPLDEWAYAGWSLIVIYSSPETQGHQLFLYDKFLYAGHYLDIDFDDDGMAGGIISGFIVPEQVPGEVNAARLTAFVGEGDECYAGDSILLNGAYLSNSASPWNNVWNAKSPGVSNDGIDIDTFDITWVSGILHTGDTTATLNLPTQVDVWNLMYIILSFRSETKTGSTISYLIRN